MDECAMVSALKDRMLACRSHFVKKYRHPLSLMLFLSKFQLPL